MSRSKLILTNEQVEALGAKYQAQMNEIKVNNLPIYIGRDHKEQYKIPEDETFTQVWTNDKTAKYYATRNQIAPYYFQSQKGTTISLYGKYPHVLTISIRDKEKMNTRFFIDVRIYKADEQGDIRPDDMQIDPCVITGLTYDAKSISYAQKVIDKFGVDAFDDKVAKRMGFSQIECHHKTPYHYGKFNGSTIEQALETRKYIAENCKPSNLLFTDEAWHGKGMTHAPKPTAIDDAKTDKELEKAIAKEVDHVKETNDILEMHGMRNHAVIVTITAEKNQDGEFVIINRDTTEKQVVSAIVTPITKPIPQTIKEQDELYIMSRAKWIYEHTQENPIIVSSEDEQRLYNVDIKLVSQEP